MIIRIRKPGPDGWEVVASSPRRTTASAAAKELRLQGLVARVSNGEVIVEVSS